MAEPTAMETVGMLQEISGKIAWGARLDFENKSRGKTFCPSPMEKHLEVNTDLLDPKFDPREPGTVKNYLSQIHDKQIKS
tara:strand:+ start:375 stop:614 length:240 start_codon:yes stop_codon:yes gene_type:complete